MATNLAPSELTEFGLISNKALEEIVGHKIDKNIVFLLYYERLWQRREGGWYEFPPEVNE